MEKKCDWYCSDHFEHNYDRLFQGWRSAVYLFSILKMSRLSITIGSTIILIIMIKLMVPEPQKNRELIQQFWANKTHADSEFEVVVCGDSRIYRGISIEDLLFDTEQGLSGINIGYSGAGLSDEYLEFSLTKLNYFFYWQVGSATERSKRFIDYKKPGS